MSKHERSPCFVLELPLVVKPGQDRVLIGRLEAGRRLYNAVLGDALARLDGMRDAKPWQAARALPKGDKARSAAFKSCQQAFGFTEYALHAVATAHKNAAGFEDRLGAHETQKIATRVWEAVEKYAFGKRGRPRFKGRNRSLHSLESKSNAAGIRWKPEIGCVVWSGLHLPAMLPNAQQDPYALEALKAKTKYCRILWRNLRGERRWFVQLVQAGLPPAKYEFLASGQEVGIDLGPSSIAIVADAAVALERFAPSIEQPWAEIRRLQRAQDRSRRATNPENYDEKGRAKKGSKVWKQSARYKRRAAELADVERKLAAARKRDHGTLANNVLGLGNCIQAEKISYQAFQRCFGRSVKVRAPDMFIDLLIRKAESAGGKLEELNTWKLRMSQYDHVTGDYAKKPLSQRWHALGGQPVLVQRDCYSAFLAKHVEDGEHNPIRLQVGWAAAEPLLRRAGLCADKAASGRPSACPTVAIPSERIARRRRLVIGHGWEVAGETRAPGDPDGFAFRTPRL